MAVYGTIGTYSKYFNSVIILFILTASFDAELAVKTFLVLVSVNQLQEILMQSPLTVISLATEKHYLFYSYVFYHLCI